MSIMIDTPEGIQFFRLVTVYHSLKLEVETGMKMTRSANPYAIAKRDYGLKGSKASVAEQLGEMVEGILAQRAYERSLAENEAQER